MAKHRRSDDWGFPRWRSYGNQSRDAATLRLCDRHGCADAGDRPAPKAPNSPERWYFCEAHAAEYNKNWNYFAGLDPAEAARRAADEARDSSGFNHAQHWGWGGPGDGSRSREEMRALSILEVDSDAEYPAIKAAYRRLAKDNHPDLKPGDADAAKRFTQLKAAYDVLSKSEERRLALGDADGADAG